MIVCLCRAVSDRTLRGLIRGGVCSADELRRCTGAGSVCGSCIGQVEEIVEEGVTGQPPAFDLSASIAAK